MATVLTLQVGQALVAEVIVTKANGRHLTFDTVCRRLPDKAVVVDGSAIARLNVS